MALGHGRVCSDEAHFDRFGRLAAERVRSLLDRFWLQAAVRRIVIYVGFRSSTGNSEVEFPFLIAQRTHADDPWPAAYDPKPTSASEP